MSKHEVVNSFKDGRYLYRQELVPCGKKGCTKCPHGPYWYAYWQVGNVRQQKYIGKKLKLVGKGKQEVETMLERSERGVDDGV